MSSWPDVVLLFAFLMCNFVLQQQFNSKNKNQNNNNKNKNIKLFITEQKMYVD